MSGSRSIADDGDMNEEVEEIDSDMLYDADPDCQHVIESADGGGIKCTKCSGWFCY